MLFKHIKSDIDVADSDFNSIYPDKIKQAAVTHFSPIKVAKIAANYLADKSGIRVLDIGAGAGKFCMIGSACTDGYFIGVEQRRSLHNLSKQIASQYNLTNIEFINSNIRNIKFKEFDAFYFYNSFYENVCPIAGLTDEIELRNDLYYKYSAYVKEQLDEMPIGTKLVTYFSSASVTPDSYKIKHWGFNDKLKMWEKKY